MLPAALFLTHHTSLLEYSGVDLKTPSMIGYCERQAEENLISIFLIWAAVCAHIVKLQMGINVHNLFYLLLHFVCTPCCSADNHFKCTVMKCVLILVVWVFSLLVKFGAVKKKNLSFFFFFFFLLLRFTGDWEFVPASNLYVFLQCVNMPFCIGSCAVR